MRLPVARIGQWICCSLGHKMTSASGSVDISEARRCVRCGHHSPAVVWNSAAIKESATRGTIKPYGPLMALSHRPPPPMPMRNPNKHRIDVEDELRWLKIVMQLATTCRCLEAEA